jgi:hypothetical protein
MLKIHQNVSRLAYLQMLERIMRKSGWRNAYPKVSTCELNKSGITYRHYALSIEAGSARVETLDPSLSFRFIFWGKGQS